MNTQSQISFNNLTFDVLISGENTKEAVFLLHGFPETNYMWRGMIEHLSQQGFYCSAPNQRGYSNGAKPKGADEYTIEKLVDDIFQMAQVSGIKQFHLIAHDWGAIIGWFFVDKYPEMILSWTAMSVPHVQAFSEALIHDKEQQKMSRYMDVFRTKGLSEFIFRLFNNAVLKNVWTDSSRDEKSTYLKIFRQPYTLTAALNYYRSNYHLIKNASLGDSIGKTKVPTLFIWGEKDLYLGRYCTERCGNYVVGDYEFAIIQGGHWLVQTNFQEVCQLITRHLLKNIGSSVQ